MFSVIIPTLFSHDYIYKMLIQLSQIDIIGEIILIDNSTNQREIKLNKLVHSLQGQNIFVNAAWNKGVNLAKYNKICLLNDDLFFDWGFFDLISSFVTADNGFIGMHVDNFQTWTDDSIFYTDNFTLQAPPEHPICKRGWRTQGWGSCIFFDKTNWDPIPENLRIWAGDDWLFYRSKKANWSIHGLKCHGEHSSTINKLDIKNILEQDMLNMSDWVKKGEIENYLFGTIWWK